MIAVILVASCWRGGHLMQIVMCLGLLSLFSAGFQTAVLHFLGSDVCGWAVDCWYWYEAAVSSAHMQRFSLLGAGAKPPNPSRTTKKGTTGSEK